MTTSSEQDRFAVALDEYVASVRKLGYTASEITLLAIGFHAGWEAIEKKRWWVWRGKSSNVG